MKKFVSLLLAIIMLLPAMPVIAEEKAALHIDFENEVPYTTAGSLTYEKGVVGNCAVFDGASYITLPDDLTKGIEDFTLSCWVRFDAITPNVWQRVFDLGNEEGSNLFLGTWQWQGSNNVRAGVLGAQMTSFGVYSLGEWVHYAAVQSTDSLKLYINGREVASGVCETRLKDAVCTQNYIGYYNKNTEPTEGFKGAVDEFIFAPYAMSGDVINEMAFVGLNDEKKVESLEARVYLRKTNNAFEYFTFDDGNSSVTWKSSRPELLTVDGIESDSKELCDVTLTAVIKSGTVTKEINFEYVVGEFDGKLDFKETTLEKIEIDKIRKTSIALDTSKIYFLKSNGKYLSEIDGKLVMNTKGNENSLWRFAKAPKTNNTYAIFNVKSGSCFDVENFGVEKGSRIIMYAGGKNMNQLWYVTADGGIIGYQSEWFLGDDFTLHGLDSYTKWDIEETENTLVQTGVVYEEPISKYMALEDGGYYAFKAKKGYLAADEDGIYFARNSYAHNAQWLVRHIEGDFYTVVNRVTGKNLNIAGNSTQKGASVIQWAGAVGNNEQFNFESTSEGVLISGKDNKNYLCYNKSLIMDGEFYWSVVKCGKAEIVEYTQPAYDASEYLTEYIPPVIEEVSEEGFVHPGILITKADIIRMQKMVREGAEPWKTSFALLAADGFSSKTVRIYAYDSNADTTALKSEARLKNMRMDARSVVNQALMYTITGDEVYRQNAMTILRMWSELRDVYTTLGSDRIDHGEIAFKMAFAAELMKYTDCESEDLKWTIDDNEKFVGMLETTQGKHDSWWYWMNQHGICNLSTLANAIFRNDMDLYKQGVERTTVNKQGGGSIDYTRGSGGSITQIFRIVDFDALNGDSIEPTLVHSEMGRDQGHAYGCLAALSLCAQLIDTQNTLVDPVTGEWSEDTNAVNVFKFADERLLQAASYIGKYNLGYDVLHPTIDIGGYYTDINDTNRGNMYVAFGILYNYYKYEEKADMDSEKLRYLKEAHEYHYPEGGINDFYIGYSDLLFTPEDAKVDVTAFERVGESATVWQAENYTALNFGKAEATDDYVALSGNTQIALTNGYYPPGGKSKVILKVKTEDEVKVTVQNEHTVYAPIVTGIIPDTNAEWQEIVFEIEPEGVLRQRIFFLTFYSEGEIEVDYMRFVD